MVAIKKYKKALFQLKTFNKLQVEEELIVEEKKELVKNKFWELESKLRDKVNKLSADKYKELRNIDSKCSKFINKINISRQPYDNIRNRVEDIFKMFDILISEKEEPTVFGKFPSIKDGKCLSILRILYDNKYKRIFVYLERNNKPKNNVTLKIKVGSIFQYYFDKVNIKTTDIRYASTEDELTEWFKNNKDCLKWGLEKCECLSDIIKEQCCLEELYEYAQGLWEKKGWKRVYWNHKKDYYSRGTEPDAYKNVLEQLRILK